MAPRTAKAKKTAEVKVAENEAPKKGRGKAKAIEEAEQELPESTSNEAIIDEKAPVEKKKRGKKAQDTNGDTQTNGSEDIAPPAKRGRKKNEPIPEEKATNGDSAEEESNPADDEHNDDVDMIEEEPAAKGRKKPAKKEEKPKESGRGRKKQASPEAEEKEVEEKPKAKGRGRKAQPKPEKAEPEDEKTEPIEEAKEPATKGRKKANPKKEPVKEKTPESEKQDSSEEKEEEKSKEPEEPKKETKGRKGKKAQAKEDEDEAEAKEEPALKKRKVTKKEEKGKGDSKDEEEVADEEIAEPEAKPKGKRGQKKAETKVEDPEADEESAETEPATKARRRKPAEDKAGSEDSKKKAPAKNKATTDYEAIDFSNSSKNPQGREWNFKISCWNVDGIRAWMSKGGLDYLKYEKPDILCLQEVKCSRDKLPDELANVPGYHAYWLCSEKDGYAGVGVYTTQLAMNVQYGLQNEDLDDEGRIITAEYEQFYLICTYVPNAGRKLVTLPKRLQWNEEFRKYVKELDKKKPVIICGDMNVAHEEIDLANPKTNHKNAGFTPEERAGMTELLKEGFVDTFRHFKPDATGAYTFWTYMSNARSRNVGWRLDYFLVSERLLPAICDNVIREQVFGSDHCPITMFLHLTSADKPKE